MSARSSVARFGAREDGDPEWLAPPDERHLARAIDPVQAEGVGDEPAVGGPPSPAEHAARQGGQYDETPRREGADPGGPRRERRPDGENHQDGRRQPARMP